MYHLYKETYVGGYGKYLFHLANAETLEELSKEVSKRIDQGYKLNELHIVKEIDFEVTHRVEYPEYKESNDATPV